MEKLTKKDIENLSFKELKDLLLLINYNQDLVRDIYETYFDYIYCYLPNGKSDTYKLEDYLNDVFPNKTKVDWYGQQGFIGKTTIKVHKEDYNLVKDNLIEIYTEEIFKNY